MANTFHICDSAGSLRNDSFNKSSLRSTAQLLSRDIELEIYDIEGIPSFNQDFERKPPGKGEEFKAITTTDALMIATLEYSYMTVVLKNVIDWSSHPYKDNCLDNEPVAIMGASSGRIGAAGHNIASANPAYS